MSIQYHDQPNTVNVASDRSTVENTDQPATVDVSTTETTVTVVSGIGAIGPQGPTGPEGPQGPPGAIASLTVSSPLASTGGSSPNLSLGVVPVTYGGTGVGSLTGYVYGNGTSAFTAATTIPNSAVSGLGTMALQNATSIAVTGGYLSDVSEEVRCTNRTGSPIAIGKAVYIIGAHGDVPEIALADASGESTAARTLGITAEAIADSGTGRVCFSGLLKGINTNSLTEGALVWLSETAGELTTTRPTQPAHGVFMGLCVKQAPGGAGILFVSVVNGQELDELHDVLITSPTAGQIFKRNTGNTLWVNASPASLTATNDTNVTLTIGGNAATALVNDASLALGWTGQLAVSRGGSGASSLSGYLVGNGGSAFTAVSSIPGSAISGDITGNAANVTGIVAVTNGGTGVGSLTGLVKANGTSAFTAATSGVDYAPATTGTAILYGNGSGGFSAVSIGSNLTFTGGTLSATGGGGGGITAVTATSPLASSGGATPDISFTGILPVSNGGSGVGSLTGYLVGNGTSAFTAVSSIPGSAISGNITGNAANVTGTVAVGNGGTGATSLTGYLVGNGASAFTAVSSIPNTAISGLGTMSTQNANNVAITGGSATSLALVTVASGTVGSPSIAAQNDTATGLYWPSSATVGIMTNGIERLRVDGTTFTSINSAGNNTFDLWSTASTILRLARYSDDANNTIVQQRKARGTISSPTAVAAGDLIGANQFQAYGGTNWRTLAVIRSDISSFTSDTDMTAHLSFSTTNAGSAAVERLRLTGFGDLAISTNRKLLLDGVPATGDTYLTEASANNIAVFTGGTERVRIDGSGNVGVATATFGSSAANVFAVKNGTEPTSGPADTVQIYSVDRSAGNTIPAIYCEGTGVTNAGITSTTVTHKIALKVNGTVYYLLATTNAT